MSWILILFLHINHLRYLFFAFFWDLREWGLSRRRNGKRNVVQEIIQGKGRGECHITETEENDYFFWDSPPPQQYIHMQVRSCFQLAPIKETHCQKSSIFYRFCPQNFFFWKRSEVAYVAWSFIFTFIYSIATSNMPKSHIRWRGEQIQFIETSYCSDNFHKISNFCRLLGKTFMKEILVVFQTYSCLL